MIAARLSLRAKLLITMVAFATVPGPAIAVFAIEAFETSSRRSTLESLEALAASKAEAIDQYVATRSTEVVQLAELTRSAVVELTRAPEKTPPDAAEPLPGLEDAEKLDDQTRGEGAAEPSVPPPEPPKSADESPKRTAARASLARMLAVMLGDQARFEELLVIDPDGRVIVSTFDGHRDRSAADIEYFKRGKAATYIQPVFVSPITDKLTMVIATPIRTADGETLGVFAARLNLERFFRLINDVTGLGETGETVVAKLIDDRPMMMAPTRFESDTALAGARSRYNLEGSPIATAVRGVAGHGGGIDYRGREVLAAWTFVPTLEWGIVAKLDLAEAYAAHRRVKNRVVWIAMAIAMLAIVIALVIASAMIAPLRKLKIATERISKGDLDVALSISSRDEIGELADSFERMVAAIKFFRERSRRETEDPAG